jgi:uncharacterized surface protein with fasciclin (FAS1) repeats
MKYTTMLMALMVVLAVMPVADATKRPSIVDVAVAANSEGPYAGSFDTLIAALQRTPGILNMLDGRGQYTVFAPTDDAFAELGLNPENIADVPLADLENILKYHVANGRRNAESVVGSDRLRMLNGQFIMQDSGVLTDNQGMTSNIIVADIMAGNGIIHVIDGVLLP